MQIPIHRYNHPILASDRGFALVATLMLMILLVIISVGVLSLSTVTLRNGSHHSAQAQAQANARMALMIAIGELQEQMGPDTRISAKAEILDTTPTTDVVDGIANPHYLGIWDSWNTWLTDRRGALSIQDTYKPGRDPSLFRRWLVSHPDSSNYAMAITDTSTADKVVLCGPGSAGKDTAKHVMASRIPIKDGSGTTGNYAWWVSDEAQKARLDLEPRDDIDTIDEAQIVASQMGRLGIEKITDMSDFDTRPESLKKTITRSQAAISAPAASERIHDLTAYSMGLLTDVRSGGFKRDLNLAFESETVPSEMGTTTLYSTRPFEAPIRPMTGVLASITPQNPYLGPMSWRQMREYYRLYRGGFSDSSSMRPVAWSGGKPSTKRLLIGKDGFIDDWDTKGYTRQIVMLRQTWIIATSTLVDLTLPGGLDYYIFAIPVISLWNPYNVSIEVDPREISHLGFLPGAMNLQQKIYKGGVLVSNTPFPDDTSTTWGNGASNNPANPGYNPGKYMYWIGGRRPNASILSNLVGFRMIITDNPTAPRPITFEPGEVRLFSTDSRIPDGGTPYGTLNSRYFFSSAGYTPAGNTTAGILRGLRYRVFPSTSPGALSCSIGFSTVANNGSTSAEIGATTKSGLVWNFQEVFDNNGDVLRENGNRVDINYIRNIAAPGRRETFWDNTWHGITCLDWLTAPELSQAWVVRDDPANRGRWPAAGSPPLPIGVVSIVAKSPERLVYDQTTGFGADYRNRSWLHSPPTRLSNFLMNPVDLNRADCPFQFYFHPVNGDQGVSEFLQADGVNGYFGGGYTPAQGQTHVTALNIPAAPIMNLASFAGIRMERGRTRETMPFTPQGKYIRVKYTSPSAGSFGAGIGNGYAHPMITANTVYTRNLFGADSAVANRSTNMNLCDDHWDHLFLANEELWDSWFCSGIAPVTSNGSVVTPKKTVAENFFSGESTQLSPHFQPELRGKTPQELGNLVENTSSTPGWDTIGSHMLNRGQFNVNSTSKEAWKALLMSLANRPISKNDTSSGTEVVDPDSQVTLSRYPLVNSDEVATGPGDDSAWNGIRKLTDEEVN